MVELVTNDVTSKQVDKVESGAPSGMNFDAWRATDLDLVRSLLCALSWAEQDAVTPVSAISIHHEVARRNREISAADALANLARIGDAQRLDHGYWLPCPTHAATDGDVVVVVSSEPTESLIQSHGPAIRQGEYGRYFATQGEVKIEMSRVPIAQWLDIPSLSTDWLAAYIDTAPFAPPIGLDGLEVYRSWKAAGRRWLPLANALQSGQKHMLARFATRGGYRYVVLRVARASVRSFHELPVGFDLARAICALQKAAEDPIRVVVKASQSSSTLSLATPIVPDGERVFLHCVGSVRVRDSSSKLEADLPIQAQADVYRLFTALGCSIQELRE